MYIVTGGAGFIGSNIVAGLEKRGDDDIVVVDRLRHEDKWRNLAKREVADIVPPEHIDELLHDLGQDVRAVIHMGAISSTTETDADLIVANNYKLSLALWRWCARHEIPLIYASSAATYGDGRQGFDDDSDPHALSRLRPLNAYGWSKHLFDRRVARMIRRNEPAPPHWAGLKFFNVYGPNEYHKHAQQSVVSQVFRQADTDNPCHLFRSHHPDYADGEQKRDFIFVQDCVDVVLWLLDRPDVSGLFNLGTGEARTFKDLAVAVYRALGREPYIKYVDTPLEIRAKYQYFTQAEMRRLREAGYTQPFTSLEDGVSAYVKTYLNTPDPYR